MCDDQKPYGYYIPIAGFPATTRRGCVLVTEVSISTAEVGGPHSEHASANLTIPRWAREVDLLIVCGVMGNAVTVQLEPGNDSVAQLFQSIYKKQGGGLRTFVTGLHANEISDVVGGMYLRLKATIERDHKLLQALTGSPNKSVPRGSVLAELSPAQENALLSVFFGSGSELYHRLFVDTPADSDLNKLMTLFDSYSRPDRPVRVRIETDGLYLPWQFLHAAGEMNPDRFWGFRYEISVSPIGLGIQERYKGPLQYTVGPLIFGEYRGDPKKEDVVSLGGPSIQRC